MKKKSSTPSSRVKRGDLSRDLPTGKAGIASSQASRNDKIALFPKINRFITETWKLLLVSFISGLILIGIIIQALGLYSGFQEKREIEEQRGKTEKELAFWKSSLSKYKNYRDIYLKIASLEYQLGDKDAARDDLSRALEIDPNSEKAGQLKKILEI